MSNLYASASGPSNIDDVYTSCLVAAVSGVKDQIFENYPTLAWLKQNGRVMKIDGGERIQEFLEYDDNDTFDWYEGYDSIDVTPQETLTSAFYEWKEGAVSITISRKEERQNSGKHKIVGLLDHRVKNAKRTIESKMNKALFATAPGVKQPNSLEELIDASDPARGDLGGIDRSTYPWWQANETASGSFAAQGLTDIRTMHTTCATSGGKYRPNFAVTTASIYDYYEKALQPQARYTDEKMLNAGFDNIKFRNMVITYDEDCNSGKMFFLHDEMIKLVIDTQSDMAVMPFVKPSNQTARTAQIVSMCQLIPVQPRKLGKLTGITA